MSTWSVRNRLFVAIAGTTVLAALSISLVYLATEPDRIGLRIDRLPFLARLNQRRGPDRI